MNALCWAIVLCVISRKVGDYTFPRTCATLIRTYETVNDRRHLLSTARETTAVFQEVLSAVIDVATVMSSATLVGFCCNACLAHRLVMWLAHFCCSLQVTWKESVQAPKKSTLRCRVPISYLDGVISFQDSCAEKLFIDAALHMSQISLVEKLLSRSNGAALIKRWVPRAACKRQFRYFNTCSEMSTCYYM